MPDPVQPHGQGSSLRGYSNRDGDTVSYISKDSTQMAKQMGRNSEESGGPKPEAQDQPQAADGR